jgi:hypothetical protein
MTERRLNQTVPVVSVKVRRNGPPPEPAEAAPMLPGSVTSDSVPSLYPMLELEPWYRLALLAFALTSTVQSLVQPVPPFNPSMVSPSV